MIKFKVKAQVVAALVALALTLSVSAAQAAAKNVILMISDGQGYNTVQATDYYTGTKGVYESFPVQYGVSTFSAGTAGHPSSGYNPNEAWKNFGYVAIPGTMTDSASAATALATGIKNYDGQLNYYPGPTPQTPMTGRTITEIAQKMNKAAGVVTTVEWSHATPAGMYAHNVSRNNYSQIANEMLGATSPLSVIMGAGNPDFNDNGQPASKSTQYVGGDATWNALKNGSLNNWTLIQEKSKFEDLANGNLLLDKVVGTFQANTTAQQMRSGDTNAAPGVVPLNPNVPDLATMSTGALNVLNHNQNGFFLMIEGGAVDWANHANQLGRMVEEQVDFNNSVASVVNWVNANSSWQDTLLIVTADHETGFLWGDKAGFPANFDPLKDNGAGNLPGARYFSSEHTNSLVPVYAMGAGSELFDMYADEMDPKRGKYIDNTEIFLVMNSQITATPIPGSVLLLGTGVLGMILIGQRRRQA